MKHIIIRFALIVYFMLVPKYGYTNVHIKINDSSEQIQNDTVRILKNPVSTTNLSNDTSKKNKKKIINTISDGLEVVTDFFMGCDTNYITPQLYQFTGQLEINYWHDYYRLTSVTTSNSMTIESSHPLIIGGYICWGIFGYGHYININDINTSGKETYGTSQRSSFTVNTSKLAAEIYTFHSGEDAKITSYADCNLSNQDNRFSGLKSKCFGLNAEYIFNNKKYSWPAAFGINAVQRKSKGSWKLGISYNHQRISFDKTKLPNHLKDIDPTLLFRNVDYKDYAISFGYGYNWVFKKNCLFAISCLPSIGYRKSDIEIYDKSNSILKNISTDVITRMSLYWNNTRFFSGLLFELHTYSYLENRFALTNSYGTLKYILGINFVKKKQ